jgi:hypothetical protein
MAVNGCPVPGLCLECPGCARAVERQQAPRSARFLHVSEDGEPDWLAELAKGGEALRRQVESIVQAAEQLAASGPARPLAQGITRAVGELLSAPKRPVAHQATAELATAIGTAAADPRPCRFLPEG